MSADPLVTIVTPSFNQGRFIRATIESVLGQGYANLEYLIVDGGSSDETAAVCAEYAGRLSFVSEPDGGQSDAINKGFRRARGEIVAWLNSDDVFLPGAIRHAVDAFNADPHLGMVYGNGFQIGEHGETLQRFSVARPFDLWRLCHVSDFILQQTAFFRRAVIDAVGYVDESLFYGMDWELFMRIGKRFPVRYLPYDMGSIREYGTTKTASGGGRRARELAAILRRHTGKLLAPGVFVYGLDTYYRIAVEKLERWARGPARRLVRLTQRAITRVSHRVIYDADRRSQGWFDDGWAAPRAHVWLPHTGARVVALDVELPGWPALRGQRINVVAGRTTVARLSPAPGRAVYTFEVPLPACADAPVALELRATRALAEPAAAPHRRRLAYLLHAAGYVS